ncbi:MAG: alpha/beta hydrolase family protein [Myxococcota bacterium]|nr:alpha/beta hydrolase family protein [Myxococcota bacterium]MDW8363506.1 alpha/beta hydrolase family protein [Myxococcales bacterium]
MTHPAVLSRIAHDSCVGEPAPRLDLDWWASLDPEFARSKEPFSLPLRDALQVRVGAATDVVLRTIAATAVGLLAVPVGFRPRQLRAAVSDGSLYGRLASTHDPTRFFAAPPRGVRVAMRRARAPLFRPRDGACEDLWFESPFVPLSPDLRDRYLAHRRNRFAHARLWRHDGPPRPTIAAIHGFTADLYHLNEWFFALPWLYRLGYDVMLVTLPFHGARQANGSPFSGWGFFAGGIGWINEAVAQSIHDFRIFAGHVLEERGAPRLGVTGISLGGFMSALLACTEPRLHFAIPNVPLVSLPDLVLEWKPLGTLARLAMHLFGTRIEQVRHLLAVSSPLTYPPLLPRERLMIIGGVGDRLAPPKHARLLWEHWGRPRLYWFPGNHLLHFDRGRYLREIARFLRQTGFSEGVMRLGRRSVRPSS